ncbi:MAG: prepilin-type N-terminal cleavage/methylation domain-containing protein [Patescibacteria group bacterium]|jgi:prepilin-type N-terminal cleavage/methylation domain-containing protein
MSKTISAASKGFSIIEALVAIAVFGVLAAGTINLVAGPMIASSEARERSRASFLAEEGIEAARSIRNASWMNLTAGDHGLAKTTVWSFSGNYDDTAEGNLMFRRVVAIEPVSRDGGGNIVASGGSVDPRTKKITATVNWISGFGLARNAVASAYFTNWNVYDWRQSTDTDFNAGVMNNVRTVGSGENASVELAPAATTKIWTPREGTLEIHNSAAFWGQGTFIDTETYDTGTEAVIKEKGVPRWIQIYAGQTFFQTTDAHFATGTPTNTVVVDTGDLGAVALASSASWAAMTSPTASHLYEVSCSSSTDCFAGGAGGTLLRWDGTAWATITSPTSRAINGIDMVSATLGFGVGTNGDAIRWNGTSWSSLPSLGTTANDVFMLSATDGWAVGNSGKFWRWNGTAWSQFVDTGNQGWMAVWMNSATDGWAVASSGALRRWNGTTWAAFTSPTNKALNGIACGAANVCFAVGAQGTIIRWNGTAWSIYASPTANVLNDVYMISATDGWATGAGGTLLRWNGTAWSSVAAPAADTINGVFQLSSNEAYAVGNGGVIWQYGNHYAASGTYISKVFDAGQNVNWGHIFWDEYFPSDATHLTIATRTGNTPIPDGTWSAWSGELTNPTNAPITSPAGRYFQYRATLTTTYTFETSRLNSVSIYYNEPAAGTYFDLKVTDLTDGWSVGQGGQIARFNGIEWSAYPSPTTDSLLDVDFSSATNVIAVGMGGRIIRWNGTTWSTMTSPTLNDLHAVKVVSATSAYAVGAKGTIIRWNGTTWSAMSSPTNKTLEAVDMLSDTDGWTVGNNGVALHWNGTAWSLVNTGTSSGLNGVAVISASDVWAVGQGGLALHWNGTSWASVASTTPNEMRDIWCTATDDCWAVGIEATFLQWNGTAWSQYVFANPSNPLVQGVHMQSASEGWAVGEGGAIYHYTPVYPSPAYWISPVIDSGSPTTLWNTISWDSLEPAGTSIVFQTRTGNTPIPDGTWSAWSAESADKGGTTITSPVGQYLQYQAVFRTTITYSTAMLQQVRLVRDAATGQNLFGVDGVAAADVWSVGRSGTIIHYNGTEWTSVASPTNRSLNEIDTVTASAAYAVGNSGELLSYDGAVWTEFTPSPTANDLNSVSMLSATDGFAVGAAGVILHWDGTTWSLASSPTGQNINGVFIYSPTLGFAVGDGGVILKWDGASWTTDTTPVATRLNDVHVLSETLGFAVGDGGVILNWDGLAWTTAVSPTVVRLNAVDIRSTSDAWAVGDFGVILQYDGLAWNSFTSPTTRSLYGVTVQLTTEGWICGEKGVLLKDPEPFFPVGTFISSVLDTDTVSIFDAAFWHTALPAGTSVTIAARTGDVPTPDASWSVWTSPETSASDGWNMLVVAGRYLQYRATLTTTNNMVTPSFEDITVTYSQ